MSRPAFDGAIPIGPLERRILDAFGQYPSGASVRDICRSTFPDRPYTTVMTTIDRLFAKRLLTRERHGRSFFYRLAPRAGLLMAGAALAARASVAMETPEQLATFLEELVDYLHQASPDALDVVERIIETKRRQTEPS